MPDATVPHRSARMTGRDPNERHRVASPLELLFDLTFVIAFGTAADQLAHGLAEGYAGPVLLGFSFATFAVSWAWINFAWFASAYDTDDWIYRLTTMLQMVGVLILALGLPAMFASLEHHGGTLDNDVMVLGYVVMRVAMLAQWWRATRHDPSRRPAHRCYLTSILIAQVLWCAIALGDFSITATFLLMLLPLGVELGGPVLAERWFGGTPWHAHHIAERYGLMVIITLGEGLLGTMASLTTLAVDGITFDLALLALAGTALTFGMWWTYDSIPHAEVLGRWRERSFVWGYGHILMFGAIVAVGAGLHVAAYYLAGESHLGLVATVLTVALPTAAYLVLLYTLYATFTQSLDPFHLILIVLSVLVLLVSILMAVAGVHVSWALLVVALTPWVSVVGYETVGYRHNAAVLKRLDAQ